MTRINIISNKHDIAHLRKVVLFHRERAIAVVSTATIGQLVDGESSPNITDQCSRSVVQSADSTLVSCYSIPLR